MKDKHTQGPWHHDEYGHICAGPQIIGKAYQFELDDSDYDELPCIPNARIMAAAPEMKEELKECRKVLKQLTFYYENVLEERIQTLETRLVNIELLLAKIEGDE